MNVRSNAPVLFLPLTLKIIRWTKRLIFGGSPRYLRPGGLSHIRIKRSQRDFRHSSRINYNSVSNITDHHVYMVARYLSWAHRLLMQGTDGYHPIAKTLEAEETTFPTRMHLVQLYHASNPFTVLSAVSSSLAFGLRIPYPSRMVSDFALLIYNPDRSGTRAKRPPFD